MTRNLHPAWLLSLVGLAAAACDRGPTNPPAPPAVAAIRVAVPDSLPLLGGTVKVAAIVLDADGDTLSGREVSWTSSDTTRARVDAEGIVSAVGPGPATITAASGGVSSGVSLRVVRPIRSSNIIFVPYVLPVGGTKMLQVEAWDSANQLVKDPQVVLTSSDPSVVAVDDAGMLRALSVGRVTIRARVENQLEVSPFFVVAGYSVVAEVGTLGGAESRAFGINDQGDVVGDAQTATGEWHAFLYRGGRMIDVGPAGLASRAVAVNSAGAVVGNVYPSADTTSGVRPFLWSDGTAALLPVPDGISSAFVTDVNDKGLAVGYTSNRCTVCTFGRAGSALRWDQGRVTDLGRFGGHQALAMAVDEQGRIAGGVEPDNRGGWLQDGTFDDLVPGIATALSNAGHLVSAQGENIFIWQGGATHSVSAGIRTRPTVLGVDDAGRVLARLGHCSPFLPACTFEGIVRLPNDLLFGLNNILAPGTTWTVVAASAMNGRGEIAGYGRESASGPLRAIVLKPR